MGRAPCCDKTKVKRGPWSPEEDSRLIEYVEKHGIGGSWIALPQKAGLKRCGKSCRLRWLNYLRPNIKHGGFTHQEDTIILTLYHNIGSRWSVIASHLPGRTDNDVKNYWNTKLKKKLLAAGKTNYLPTVPPPPPPQTLTMLPCILPVDLEILDSQIPLPGLIDNDVNAYNLALLADGGSTASWSSVNGLSEDEEAFLVEFGSGYDLLDAFDFHERFNDPKSLM